MHGSKVTGGIKMRDKCQKQYAQPTLSFTVGGIKTHIQARGTVRDGKVGQKCFSTYNNTLKAINITSMLWICHSTISFSNVHVILCWITTIFLHTMQGDTNPMVWYKSNGSSWNVGLSAISALYSLFANLQRTVKEWGSEAYSRLLQGYCKLRCIYLIPLNSSLWHAAASKKVGKLHFLSKCLWKTSLVNSNLFHFMTYK